MEAVLMLLAIAFVVFIFGIYADSGSKSSRATSIGNHPTIEYYMVNKKP